MDREIGRNFSLSVGYVGSAGRRLPSSIQPLNALNPQYLSMGNQLYDEFQPGMTSLHGVPLPYAGWVEQMTGARRRWRRRCARIRSTATSSRA